MLRRFARKHIFNLSLHRSGTQSTHDLFRRNSIKSIHWPARVNGTDYEKRICGRETDLDFVARVLRPVFRQYAEVSDVPIPALYRQLTRRYPRARFYIMVRPASSWIDSVRRHIGTRAFDPFERVLYWRFFSQLPPSVAEISDSELVLFHEWHHQTIFDFFKSAPALLVLQLGDSSNGRRLCRFCGVTPLRLRIVDYALGHDASADPDLIDAAFG